MYFFQKTAAEKGAHTGKPGPVAQNPGAFKAS